MKRYVILTISLLAVVAMCAFIFWMSAQPEDESSAMSMGVVYHIISFIVPGYDQLPLVDQLYWQAALEHPVRKTAHFLEYALLGALMFNAAARCAEVWGRAPFSVRDLVGLAWALSTAYAATDEIHQMFVPGRAGMVTDVILDSAGVLVGVMLVTLAYSRRKKYEKNY